MKGYSVLLSGLMLAAGPLPAEQQAPAEQQTEAAESAEKTIEVEPASAEELESSKKFASLDQDGDGRLSEAEASGDPTLEDFFVRADDDVDGFLSRGEFHSGMHGSTALTDEDVRGKTVIDSEGRTVGEVDRLVSTPDKGDLAVVDTDAATDEAAKEAGVAVEQALIPLAELELKEGRLVASASRDELLRATEIELNQAE